MILMYSHLIIADWKLTLWYRKQLWGTFHYAIRVLFCKISQFLYCFAKFKFFLKGSSWWNNWAGNCLLGRYWPQVKSKFTCNLQWHFELQCNAMQEPSVSFKSKVFRSSLKQQGSRVLFCRLPRSCKGISHQTRRSISRSVTWSAACHLSKSSSSVPSL